MQYFYLFLAIVAEVIGTTALKSSENFTLLLPSIVVVITYAIAFYCLSLCLNYFNTGTVYAIWSGLGIILISIASYFIHKQILNTAEIIGISLIIAGVLVINLFSKTLHH